MEKTFEEIFNSFKDLNILVVGDLMIDAYMIGKVERISPEAPVPVVSIKKRENRLGGAANVGLNLKALGVNTSIIGVVGDDVNADLMVSLLEKSGIESDAIVKDASRPTTIKTRIVSNNQQMIRVDEEVCFGIDKDIQHQIILAVKSKIDDGLHAIIFEDYNKGLLQAELIESIVNYAKEKGVFTCVDPKKDNFLAYKNVTLFKPNLKELREGLNIQVEGNDINSLSIASKILAAKLQNDITLITLSEHGVYINNNCTHHHEKAHIRDISDVSGAGDTVISVATACLATGMSIDMVAGISNLAGGLVCEIPGVVPINKDTLLKEVNKLYGA